MKKFLSVCLVMSLFFVLGCAKPGAIGDGEIDEVESAIIRLATGAVLSSKPELIVPAYVISTVLLNKMESGQIAALENFDTELNEEIDKLELTELEKKSANDLVVLLKAKIKKDLDIEGIPQEEKFVVVKDLLMIVKQSSNERIIK